MYEIRILDNALKDLKRLDKAVSGRIIKKIKRLGENFEELQHESLTGELSYLFKLRAGDYRILYEINHEKKFLIIHLIGHRKEIYE